MADPATFTFGDFGRSLLALSRLLPNWLLRWRWSREKLLNRIEAFHFDQPSRFLYGDRKSVV